DRADLRPCRCAGDEGTILAFSSEVRPHRDEVLSRTDLPDWGRGVVRGRSVLQLAERAGRDSRRPVVLRDERQGAGDEVEGELPEPDGVSAAHGSGDGVCVAGGGGDEPVLRGDGGVAGQVRLVCPEQQGAYLAGRGQEAKRPGLVRHARECLYLVPGEPQGLSRSERRAK